jgi:cation transport ATPase
MSAPATLTERVELPIAGMTCASCANRIERKLNKLEGVTATVNYATEKARVEYDPGTVAPEQLVGAAGANLKHGIATIDTLISVGVLAAWLWSLYALFIGDAAPAPR